MTDDFNQHVDRQFPLRPSGKDWERLLEVVEELERRKQSGLPATQLVTDICDVYVLAHIARQRVADVTEDVRHINNKADLWAEGFQYGVLFQRFGGTANEHALVPSKTTLVSAMHPVSRVEDRGSQADNPDWSTMDRVIDELLARFATDVSTEQLYNEIVDTYAMVYIAVNRVGLNFNGVITEDQSVDYTDAWVEGFMYGLLFERQGSAAGRAR